jgi:hypothetical protein
MIEDHWHEIAERTVQEIRRDPELPTVSTRPDSELYEWCRDILKNLGYWLSASKADEVSHRFGALGRLRYEESVPLHEAVHRFHLLKYKMIEFVREHGFAQNSLQVFAEEELEHRVNRFFDTLVHSLVRGYERAMRSSDELAS